MYVLSCRVHLCVFHFQFSCQVMSGHVQERFKGDRLTIGFMGHYTIIRQKRKKKKKGNFTRFGYTLYIDFSHFVSLSRYPISNTWN